MYQKLQSPTCMADVNSSHDDGVRPDIIGDGTATPGLLDREGTICYPSRKLHCSGRTFKRRVLKNVYVMGCVMALTFTSLAALVNLQSSLFPDQGLGVVCQDLLNVAVAIGALFLPKTSIAKLDHRWSLVVALQGQLVWISANGYATWLTMGASSVILGFSTSLF
ncbi:hypothetical protein LSH36_166g04078 [Paralvinella palmiformis]|uniref:Uncharacterized protein n=1 Tax=Paralvinella palmiformis TaxID=53620 RepID=A0AAD9JU26_9ANNE|nr:hypothetical protein LSH36_166g04078 [Paralvinella palmiformis]